ncbi:hypothetical protein RchiOBHm_Chr6g0279411 [Rosa chinensis]|uniref:Uncharacterized protein n=1 Tax=Rosa chinensis TaxID=74649 RepID=A0A2P6PT29_ROSCH|nr:hypothetical protein RchiOBHm_Chr6g0279411 [Rosa chinensis]
MRILLQARLVPMPINFSLIYNLFQQFQTLILLIHMQSTKSIIICSLKICKQM